MKILREAREIAPAKVCLAIGFFDGVHLGHQHILRQTATDAAHQEAVSVVVTFDRHPRSVVSPERSPPLVYSLSQRLRVIETLGLDFLLLIPFDRAFSNVPAEAFIRGLSKDFGTVKSICVGANFVFGHNRSGNVEMLRNLGRDLGFAVHGLAAVSLDGLPVSSTRIREAAARGDLDGASQMLGRAYSLAGTIGHGDKLGTQLGFPTANLEVPGLVLPPHGVYVAHALVAGRKLRAVVNIGHRPTLQNPNPQPRIEAHLIDFHGDLYGQEMEIIFVDKLRDEIKFPDLAALRLQIARDILAAQMRF